MLRRAYFSSDVGGFKFSCFSFVFQTSKRVLELTGGVIVY